MLIRLASAPWILKTTLKITQNYSEKVRFPVWTILSHRHLRFDLSSRTMMTILMFNEVEVDHLDEVEVEVEVEVDEVEIDEAEVDDVDETAVDDFEVDDVDV